MENVNVLGFLVRSGRRSVATCDYSIVLPHCRLSTMLFEIMTGAIFSVDFLLDGCSHLSTKLLMCSL